MSVGINHVEEEVREDAGFDSFVGEIGKEHVEFESVEEDTCREHVEEETEGVVKSQCEEEIDRKTKRDHYKYEQAQEHPLEIE